MNIVNIKKHDLNLLLMFELLMQECNVSRAAERANITQSAMSHCLSRLREMLQDPVLVRANKGMKATERALALREPIRKILLELEQTLTPAKVFDPLTDCKSFSLIVTDYTELLLIRPLLLCLENQAANIQLSFRKVTPANMAAFEAGEIDFFIGRAPKKKLYLEDCYLFSDHYCSIVRNNHPQLRKKLTKHLFLKMQHVVLSPDEDGKDIVDRMLGKNGLQRMRSITTPYISSLISMVESSKLIATIPRRIVDHHPGEQHFRVYRTPIEVPDFSVHLCWHERSRYDSGHQWMKNLIVTVAADLDG